MASQIFLRYVDIFLGLLLLASLLCLLYGSYSESRLWVIAFITGSLAVVLSYWCCYLYNTQAAHLEEYPDAEGTISEVATVLSVLYVLLLLPVLVLYRSLELAATGINAHQPSSPTEEELKPPRYHEGDLIQFNSRLKRFASFHFLALFLPLCFFLLKLVI